MLSIVFPGKLAIIPTFLQYFPEVAFISTRRAELAEEVTS